MSSLASATSKMFSGTLVSRILGQVRLIVLIGALGVTAQADAFQVANTLPNTIYNLIAGGVLNAILVPHIVKAMKRGDDAFVNRLITLAGSILLGLTVVLTFASSLLVTIFASQLAPEWFHLAVAFAFWCVPQVFFYGMYTLLGNVLNARAVFGPYMWAPVINNVIAIAGLVAYIWIFGGADAGADPTVWDSTRIAMVGGFATLGVAAQAIVLIYPLKRSGFVFRLTWGVRGSGLGAASRMAGWAFGALLVGQLGNIVLVNVASAANGAAEAVAAAGGGFVPSYVAYTGAFAIYMLPHSLITVSLVTALFTRMSEHAAERNVAGVRSDLSFGLRTVGVFTVFAAAAFVVLAIPLVQAALPTTPPSAAPGFAAVLVALSLGIPGQALWTMVQRVSFAFEDARTLFYIQIPMALMVAAGGIGVFVAPAQWWVVIVCACMSASQWMGGIIGYLALRPKLRLLDGGRVFRTHLRLSLAVVPAALIGWLILRVWGPLSEGAGISTFALGATKTIVVGALMGAIYVALLRALHVDELDAIIEPILRRLRRPVRPTSDSSALSNTMGAHDDPGRKESAVLPLAAGDLLSGRFRLDDLTHTTERGAELWRGLDTVMGRAVVAFLAPPEIRDAVLDGARRAAILTDPRLADIVDMGEQDGCGYVVCALPDGRDAADLTVDDATARAIVGECAALFNTARKRGIHHGAFSSDCVRVTPTGEVVVLGLGYFGAAGGLIPVNAPTGGTDQEGRPPAPHLEGAFEERDPVERSIARSRRDAEALLTLRATLGGTAESLSVQNAGDVMRAMTPWGNIVLPPEPEPARAVPLWKRLRAGSGPSEPQPERNDASTGGGPAAAEEGASSGFGPAAAALEAPQWGLPEPPGTTAPAEFDDIIDGSPSSRGVPPAHVGQDLPSSAVAAAAASAAAGATSAAISKWAKGGAEFAKLQASRVAEARVRFAEESAERKATRAAAAEAAAKERAEREAAAAHEPPRAPENRIEAAVLQAPVGASAPLPPFEERRRIDPGPFVIGLVIIGLVVAIVLAMNVLKNAGAPVVLPPREDPVAVETTPGESAPPEETTEQAEVAAIPVIAQINVLDPEGDGQENQELAGRAFDGDLASFWRSRSYVNPAFGMKSGIGLDVVLAEPAIVTEIEIVLAGEGGHVQVKTDPADANRQDPIAEADLTRTTLITLAEPTELSHVVLWFTALPVADSDGKNRIELLEVEIR